MAWHPLLMVIATLGAFFSIVAIIFHWVIA
jgi:hypothetical protein